MLVKVKNATSVVLVCLFVATAVGLVSVGDLAQNEQELLQKEASNKLVGYMEGCLSADPTIRESLVHGLKQSDGQEAQSLRILLYAVECKDRLRSELLRQIISCSIMPRKELLVGLRKCANLYPEAEQKRRVTEIEKADRSTSHRLPAVEAEPTQKTSLTAVPPSAILGNDEARSKACQNLGRLKGRSAETIRSLLWFMESNPKLRQSFILQLRSAEATKDDHHRNRLMAMAQNLPKKEKAIRASELKLFYSSVARFPVNNLVVYVDEKKDLLMVIMELPSTGVGMIERLTIGQVQLTVGNEKVADMDCFGVRCEKSSLNVKVGFPIARLPKDVGAVDLNMKLYVDGHTFVIDESLHKTPKGSCKKAPELGKKQQHNGG